MKNSIFIVLILTLVLGVTLTADALLIDRGGGMFYSTEMNVTWLQDSNYAQTSGYVADGRMSWNDATRWAENLSYAGFDDWRLPTFDASDPGQNNGVGLLYEIAYLSAVELGNARGSYPMNTGPFSLPSDPGGQWVEPWFWTSTLASSNSAWRYDFSCG